MDSRKAELRKTVSELKKKCKLKKEENCALADELGHLEFQLEFIDESTSWLGYWIICDQFKSKKSITNISFLLDSSSDDYDFLKSLLSEISKITSLEDAKKRFNQIETIFKEFAENLEYLLLHETDPEDYLLLDFAQLDDIDKNLISLLKVYIKN